MGIPAPEGDFVRKVVSVFSGRLQAFGTPGSGLAEIEHQCHQIASGCPGMRSQLYPWDVDADDVAESRWRYRPSGGFQSHLVVGYSWGGQTAVNFCRALLRRGEVVIVGLYLCDPVRRWRLPRGIRAIPSLLGVGSLVVPDEVEYVFGVRQRAPRWSVTRCWYNGLADLYVPAGHDVVWRGCSIGMRTASAGHSYIDNDSLFREEVIKATARLANAS